MEPNGINPALHLIESMHAATEHHRTLLQEHAQLLQEHSGTLKEIRMHLFKLDDIATNTGKLANSVDTALGRVFTMLEKREDNSRRGSAIVTGILGLLLIILSLAVTKFELQAGNKDSHITIRENGNKTAPQQ
jgi:hypothetical protein